MVRKGPGAVYLAAVAAAHSQKGIPAYKIYGKEVQDADDESIPSDVQEKIFRFIRSGLAVSIMRGKSYLSMGGTSMGIVGSTVDPNFFEAFLGMRVEFSDMTEFIRRMEGNIFDEEEFKRARGACQCSISLKVKTIMSPKRRRSAGTTGQRVGDIGPDVSDCKRLDGGESSS